MLQKGVETLQSQVSCFNMGSILIKPVQRILKYPLILNELIKVKKLMHIKEEFLISKVSFFELEPLKLKSDLIKIFKL